MGTRLRRFLRTSVRSATAPSSVTCVVVLGYSVFGMGGVAAWRFSSGSARR